ncbi:Mannuronan C-5-epimerase [Ectocarpus siliculosus]|uniref:Mannuronan C-5-epimerase n=1 Tax=Ectocarpus siliculosus TaxID=2880 RepID=D7FWK3_ECTSI|nr:Mannuronan C-5-epimerase [Ectocarpus siliculosus]|eukprot:CBJ32091.1 Mannuronan C-5-epimerase [Ectocarpus siliculosus]
MPPNLPCTYIHSTLSHISIQASAHDDLRRAHPTELCKTVPSPTVVVLYLRVSMSPSSTIFIASLALLTKHAEAAGCDGQTSPKISYDDGALHVQGGCATIHDLIEYRTNDGKQIGPIFHFDEEKKWYTDTYTGTYYLESDVFITNGATLSIDGSESEKNECESLLLASNSSTFNRITAHGGNLDIRYTKIFSWDLENEDYDTEPSDGRSYLSAVTEKITGRTKDTCPDDSSSSNGQAKKDMGNANMDIHRSEIGYLGYDGSEAYGISYKARGLCKDHSNLDIFDDDNGLNVGVTGDIYRSDLHHNWFGHYSWGHDGGKWQYNTVHDNYGYGFDPHDDSDKLRIIGNEVYNNGWHGINGVRWSNGANGNRVWMNDIVVEADQGADFALYMFKGTDPQEAEGNEDGRIRDNSVYKNEIWSDQDLVWKATEAEDNVFWVRSFLFMGFRKK